jgi:hypothetical protein
VRHPRDLPLLLRGQPGQAIGRIFHLDVDGVDPGLGLGRDHLAIFPSGNKGEGRLPLDEVGLRGDHSRGTLV